MIDEEAQRAAAPPDDPALDATETQIADPPDSGGHGRLVWSSMDLPGMERADQDDGDGLL